jgi:flagellar biogenesis protein FliO
MPKLVSRFSVLFFAALVAAPSAWATYHINAVTVNGDKQADVAFSLTDADAPNPTIKIEDNIVELSFNGAELGDRLGDKVELVAPHALVNRVSAFSPEPRTVRARIAVNGSLDNLKNRVSLKRSKDGVTLVVTYPKGENATLDLLKEEQLPFGKGLGEKPAKTASFGATQILLISLMFVLAGAASYFFVRFLRSKSGAKGTRKYLIEQVSYCPLGPKLGVSLIKVGTDFVLVGVTPNQISMLSTLPKLQREYEDSSSFERENFKQAVKEEFDRIKTPSII